MLHLRTPPSGLQTAPRAHCFLGRFLPELRRRPHGCRRFFCLPTQCERCFPELDGRCVGVLLGHPEPRGDRYGAASRQVGPAPIGAREARYSSTETVCKNVDNCIYRHVNRVPSHSFPIRSGEGVIRSRTGSSGVQRRLATSPARVFSPGPSPTPIRPPRYDGPVTRRPCAPCTAAGLWPWCLRKVSLPFRDF